MRGEDEVIKRNEMFSFFNEIKQLMIRFNQEIVNGLFQNMEIGLPSIIGYTHVHKKKDTKFCFVLVFFCEKNCIRKDGHVLVYASHAALWLDVLSWLHLDQTLVSAL